MPLVPPYTLNVITPDTRAAPMMAACGLAETVLDFANAFSTETWSSELRNEEQAIAINPSPPPTLAGNDCPQSILPSHTSGQQSRGQPSCRHRFGPAGRVGPDRGIATISDSGHPARSRLRRSHGARGARLRNFDRGHQLRGQ